MSNSPQRFLYLLGGIFLLAACMTTKPLRVHNLANYDANAPHQILFLDFTISKPDPENAEQVSLDNAILGNGTLKNLGGPVHTPYQIKLLRHFTNKQPPEEEYFEHPLFRQLEVASQDGRLERRGTTLQSAPLSFRLQYTPGIERIELFSIAPNHKERKIYTLPIKP
jgi:hypothetical protein